MSERPAVEGAAMWRCVACGALNAELAEQCGACGAGMGSATAASVSAGWGQDWDALRAPGGGASPEPTESQVAQTPQLPPEYGGKLVDVVPVPTLVEQELPAALERRTRKVWQYLLGCVIGAVPAVATWAFFTASDAEIRGRSRTDAFAEAFPFLALTGSCLEWVTVLSVMVVLLCIKRVRFVGFGILTAIFLTPPLVIGLNDGVDTLLRAIGR